MKPIIRLGRSLALPLTILAFLGYNELFKPTPKTGGGGVVPGGSSGTPLLVSWSSKWKVGDSLRSWGYPNGRWEVKLVDYERNGYWVDFYDFNYQATYQFVDAGVLESSDIYNPVSA